MNTIARVLFRITLPALLTLGLVPGPACAQQLPLTGSMLDSPRASADTPPDAPLPPSTTSGASQQQTRSNASEEDRADARRKSQGRNDFGATTRALFELQASGQSAGRPLPVLGEQAGASYARYLQSFQYPIPEFFKTTVQDDSGN